MSGLYSAPLLKCVCSAKSNRRGNFLQSLIDSPEFSQENETAKQRIQQTHDFISTLTIWANEMLKLSTSTMVKILKVGAGIQKFFR